MSWGNISSQRHAMGILNKMNRRSPAHPTKAWTWIGVDSVDSERQINWMAIWKRAKTFPSAIKALWRDGVFVAVVSPGFRVAIFVSWDIQWKRKIGAERQKIRVFKERGRAPDVKRRSHDESGDGAAVNKHMNRKVGAHARSFLISYWKTITNSKYFPTVKT